MDTRPSDLRIALAALLEILVPAALVVGGCVGLLYLFASCSSPPSPSVTVSRQYQSALDQLEHEASIRILILCPDGRQHMGSGVAVTPRHAITARHVVECDGAGPVDIVARLQGGATARVAVDALGEGGLDVALLVAEGTGQPFGAVPALNLDPPRIGQLLCLVGGDGPEVQGLRKCGSVAGTWRSLFVFAAHIVPGNSGGAIWDEHGRVVGIGTQAEWHEGREHFGVGLMTRAWSHLVPREWW